MSDSHIYARECTTADQRPQDVNAQIAAAYACDRTGAEHRAVAYYDAAWALGVPAEKRAHFLLGYGSTLRNVGRIADSLERLTSAVAEFPDQHALKAFLALTLHSAGRPTEALATVLDALVAAQSDNLMGTERALRTYIALLRQSID